MKNNHKKKLSIFGFYSEYGEVWLARERPLRTLEALNYYIKNSEQEKFRKISLIDGAVYERKRIFQFFRDETKASNVEEAFNFLINQ
jgi:hypothetical protein